LSHYAHIIENQAQIIQQMTRHLTYIEQRIDDITKEEI
jgi:hypothetical protein